MPADAMEILPGLDLAAAIKSGTVFAGKDGFTTRVPAKRVIPETGAISRIECKRDCYPTFRRGSGGGVMRPDERFF